MASAAQLIKTAINDIIVDEEKYQQYVKASSQPFISREDTELSIKYLIWAGQKERKARQEIVPGQGLQDLGFEAYKKKDYQGTIIGTDPLGNQKKIATIDALYNESVIFKRQMHANTQEVIRYSYTLYEPGAKQFNGLEINQIGFGSGSAGTYIMIIGTNEAGNVKVTGSKTFIDVTSGDQVAYFKRNGRFDTKNPKQVNLQKVVGYPMNMAGPLLKGFKKVLANFSTRDANYLKLKRFVILLKKIKKGNNEYKIQRKFLAGQKAKGGIFNPAGMAYRMGRHDVLEDQEKQLKNTKAVQGAKYIKRTGFMNPATRIKSRIKNLRDSMGKAQQKQLSTALQQQTIMKDIFAAQGKTQAVKETLKNAVEVDVTQEIAE